MHTVKNQLKKLFYYLCSMTLIEFIRFIRYRMSSSREYVYNNPSNKKWAYVSYIATPFYKRNDIAYLNRHQAHREALVIGQVLASNGYNFVMQDFYVPFREKGRKFDLIFGHEPNLEVASKSNPEAIKVYYATGAYYKHQNGMVKMRTVAFNEKYHVNIPYRRLAVEHSCCEVADRILQIGSKFTLNTYPVNLRHKVTFINQSSNYLQQVDLNNHKKSAKKTHFLWLGSGGSLLKCADLVIEAFLSHPELHIDIVGPIEEDVMKVYAEALSQTTNIVFHGFVDVNSSQFADISKNITFMLYPSSTEGGAPGAVIVAMKNGIIPILSEYASFDDVDELGFRLDSLSIDAVERGLEWSQSLTEENLAILMQKNYEYAKRWNLEDFKVSFDKFVKSLQV